MKFVDFAVIKIKSGAGGNGCVSFRREKFVPRGGPNGGDGGDGGNIVFQASSHLSTLLDLKYKKFYNAQRGMHGQGGDKKGKNGKDKVVTVPCGTVIKDLFTNDILAELVYDGQKEIILKGGKGGRGNTHFKSAVNQAPRYAEKGKPGIEKEIIVELKLIADVGLVGLPNAGKSTLISVISSAKPKIADYPFTTLTPNLGIVRNKQRRDFSSFVVADIPGLIEGASKGKGLGIQFLRHIERTKILVFLVDSTKLSNSDSLLEDYYILENELKKYNRMLLSKPQILCFTKIDAISEETRLNIKRLRTKKNKVMISSITGENLSKLINIIFKELRRC
ncbi:MAG: GTPase ObgE [Ignavibacteria bacterium]|nr:GTPase ObgE [Ignavibacteria bacterium]